MQDIIRNDLNAALLKEAEARGYQAYVDGSKAHDSKEVPGFYLGSVAKRIRDDSGIRYSIHIAMFDLKILTPQPLVRFMSQASVQFVVDERDIRSNVDHEFTTFDEIENFFDKMWLAMGFRYYDRD